MGLGKLYAVFHTVCCPTSGSMDLGQCSMERPGVAVLFSTWATVTPMGYGRSWEPRALAESSGSQLDYTPHSS